MEKVGGAGDTVGPVQRFQKGLDKHTTTPASNIHTGLLLQATAGCFYSTSHHPELHTRLSHLQEERQCDGK